MKDKKNVVPVKTYSVTIEGSTPEELDEMILRAALDIRERRDAARRQRVVDFMRGKNAR